MTRKLLISVVILAALCASAAAKENDPAVSATVDRRTILVGDRIRYTLESDLKGEAEFKFPKFADDKIGDFEIKDSGTRVRKGLFGRRVQQYWFDITTYAPGRHTIPEAEIRYRKKGDKDWLAKKTKTLDVIVESVLPKTIGAIDIKDIKAPLAFFEINWLFVTGALLILLTGAAIFLIRRLARKAEPQKSPHEAALEELEAIRAAFARLGDVKAYYVDISDSVRRYIERVFRLKAPEMTTEEFLNSLADSSVLLSLHKERLKTFLGACDLVKFAKYAPTSPEIESVFITAKGFIEETKNVLI